MDGHPNGLTSRINSTYLSATNIVDIVSSEKVTARRSGPSFRGAMMMLIEVACCVYVDPVRADTISNSLDFV